MCADQHESAALDAGHRRNGLPYKYWVGALEAGIDVDQAGRRELPQRQSCGSWRWRIQPVTIRCYVSPRFRGCCSVTYQNRQETAKPFMEVVQILDSVVARFIGTKHERDVKKLQPIVVAINAAEPGVQALGDEELKLRYGALRAEVQERLQDADPAEPGYRELMQKALEPALVPTFALVREAGRRFLKMRHFDVQLIGGMVLHEGKIAEMKTGEGKTLVATLPAVLNALAGRGVHIVTVNDYLARRDAEWMSPLY